MSAKQDRSKDRSDAETISDDRITFEGIREVVARVEPPARTGQRAHAGGAHAREDGGINWRIVCQPGGALHTSADCQRCARFVNWLPSPDRSQVTVRCLWHEGDRAADLMAHASVVPTATETMSVGEAAIQAGAAGMPFLAVAENGSFRGILRTDDLEVEPRTLVRERMIRPTWHVAADATLGEVVEVMKAHGTDIVPVLAGDELLGVVTRVALCDAGLASAFDEP